MPCHSSETGVLGIRSTNRSDTDALGQIQRDR